MNGYLTVERELSLKNLVINGVSISSVEWWVAAKQYVQDYTARPHVALFIVLALNNFGRNIVGLKRFVSLIWEMLTVPILKVNFWSGVKCVEIPKSITLTISLSEST